MKTSSLPPLRAEIVQELPISSEENRKLTRGPTFITDGVFAGH
jgi:hypothetical protein